MKYFITILMVLTLGVSVHAQNSEKKIEGFREFLWGQEMSEMMLNGEQATFISVDKEKDGNYYVLAGENLTLGNISLKSIEYVFSKKDDKFYKVVLTGKKDDVEQMNFIVDYKYGKNVNEDEKDDRVIKQWIMDNVTITLKDFTFNKFELILKSDWEAAEAYRKNTNVSDF